MSLVNDLIIEVDRRKHESGGVPSAAASDSPLDGLASPRRMRPPEPPRDWLRFGVAGFAVASIAVVALFLHGSELQLPGGSSESTTRRPWQNDTARGAVSAARSAPKAIVDSSSSLVVRSVSISKLSSMTRIRIATDSQGEYRIEGAGEGNSIRIILSGAKLAAPLPPLDLASNGLRSWQLIENDEALVIQIELPKAVPVQSQWIAAQGGAALFVDLSTEAEDDPVRSADRSSNRSETRLHADVTGDQPTLAEVASPDAWLDQPALESPASRIHAAEIELGTEGSAPTGVGIVRSADDYDRTLRKNARAEADRVLHRGRFARAEGNLPAAAALYASGLAASPGHRALTLERIRLLVEMNEMEDALAMIRDARREEPRDVPFAMLHARLLERMSDLPSALAILEESPFEISQAPEIFALAAAYLQKSGDHPSAIERYEALVRRFPDRSDWWMGLGISLDASARSKEALDVYKIALEVGALPEVSRSWVSGRVRSLQDKG